MPQDAFDRHLLFILDSETLLENHPSPSDSADSPTTTQARHLFIQGARPEGWQGPDEQPFNLSASPGDSLHIRFAPIALRGENLLFVHDLQVLDNSILSPATASTRPGVQLARPRFDNLLEIETETADDFFWESRLNAHGRTGIDIRFALLGNDCSILGYFSMPLELDFHP